MAQQDKEIKVGISFNTNAEKTAQDLNKVSGSLNDLQSNTNTATESTGKFTKSLKDNGTAVLDNGGAMGLLNDLTGGYAMMVKDGVEALELFTKSKKADTIATNANTVATEAGVAATEGMTIAQRAFNLVAKANPYVLLATAIIGVVGAAGLYIKAQNDSAAATAKTNVAVDAATKSTKALGEAIQDAKEKVSAANDIEILRAKSLGATTAEIRKLIAAQNEAAVSEAINNTNKALDNARKASNAYTAALINGDDEVIKKAKETYEAAQKISDDAAKAITGVRDAQTKANLENTIEENAEKKSAQEKADALAIEAEKKRNEAILKTRKEYLERTKFDSEALEVKAVSVNDLIDDIKTKGEAENAAKKEVMLQDLANKVELSELEIEEARRKEQMIADAKHEAVDSMSEALQELGSAFDETNNANAAFVEAGLQLDRIYADGKIEAVEAISAGLAVGAAAAGKQTALGKTLAIAQTTINTYQSATAAYAGMTSSIPGPVGIAAGVVAAAASVAMGIANVKKILSVKVPAAGGAAGGGEGGAPAAAVPASAAPSVSFVASSNNQLASAVGGQINAKTSQPIKAYVVANDVTTQQALDRKAVNNSTIG